METEKLGRYNESGRLSRFDLNYCTEIYELFHTCMEVLLFHTILLMTNKKNEIYLMNYLWKSYIHVKIEPECHAD